MIETCPECGRVDPGVPCRCGYQAQGGGGAWFYVGLVVLLVGVGVLRWAVGG